jgi:hypothetical protein
MICSRVLFQPQNPANRKLVPDMFMLANENGIEFRSVDHNGVTQFASFGSQGESECTLEATTEDIARYAGKSTLSLCDRVLLTILKRIPQ